MSFTQGTVPHNTATNAGLHHQDLIMSDQVFPSSPLSPARSDVSALFTPRKTALNSNSTDIDDYTPRTTRKRIAPTRLEEGLDEPAARKRRTPPLAKHKSIELSRSSSPSVMTSARKQPLRGNWSVSHLMTNPKSKFATVDLPGLLKHERAWTELSREQQEQLISMLPGASLPQLPDGDALFNVPKEYMRSNNSFLADVGFFQEDLKEGRYDPKWLQDAQVAMQKRANGDFDDWKERNKEEFWGQKQKIDWNARAGDSSQHSLKTLVKAGLFKVGDVWHMRRGHGRGGAAMVVEKDATVRP